MPWVSHEENTLQPNGSEEVMCDDMKRFSVYYFCIASS